MENDFSFIELRIIQSLLPTKSFADIAEVVEKPESLIADYARRITLNSGRDIFQQRIDDKKILKDFKKQCKQQKNAEQESIKAREKELKRIKLAREHEATQGRRRKEPSFNTLVQDYSQFRCIRIDNKTIIYAKPGEDPVQVKTKYLQRLQSRSELAADSKTRVVKKFK